MKRIRLSRFLIVSLLFVCVSSPALASEPGAGQERPPWLEEDVIAAAMTIGMSDDQRVQFRESVTVFLESFRDEVERLVRRGVPNLENAVKRKRNALVRDMDERMAGFLNQDQMPPYETYRDLLLSKLTR